MPERFRLERLLGAGTFSTVYRAVDQRSGGAVALKVIHPHILCAERLRRRIEHEIEAYRRVDHPNVLKVLDAQVEAGFAWLALEYLAAPNLATLLAKRRFSPAEAALVVDQLCAALEALHALGILHRDVKPANMVVFPDGRTVLMDLGLARMSDATALTATGALVGTPAYLAREVLLGEEASPRSDVYGAGLVLYELLTGEAPHVGRSLRQVVQEPLALPAPHALDPAVPEGLSDLALRATSGHPEERPAGAAELRRELVPFLKAAPRGGATTAAPAVTPDSAALPRVRPGTGGLAAGLALGLALGLLLAGRGGLPNPRPPLTLEGAPRVVARADGVGLGFRTSSPATGLLTVVAAGPDFGSEALTLSSTADAVHDFVVPLEACLAERSQATFTAVADDGRRVSSGALAVPEHPVARLLRATAGLRARWSPSGSGVPPPVSGASERGRLDAPPLPESLVASARAVLPTARATLTSPTVSLGAKLRLYDALVLLERVDVVLEATGVTPAFGFSTRDCGFVRLAVLTERPFPTGRPPAGCPTHVIRPEAAAEFVPQLPEDHAARGVQDFVIANYDAVRNVKLRSEAVFELAVPPGFLERCGGRALVCLEGSPRLTTSVFRVVVDDVLPLNLCARVKEPYVQGVFVFEIPSGVLREGANQVRVTLLPACSRYNFETAFMVAVSLLPGTMEVWSGRLPWVTHPGATVDE